MNIGVPREVKPSELRVALTPAGSLVLAEGGRRVLIETGAGQGSGYSDHDYRAAGAEILSTASAVWSDAELVLKVKGRLRANTTTCGPIGAVYVPAPRCRPGCGGVSG